MVHVSGMDPLLGYEGLNCFKAVVVAIGGN